MPATLGSGGLGRLIQIKRLVRQETHSPFETIAGTHPDRQVRKVPTTDMADIIRSPRRCGVSEDDDADRPEQLEAACHS